MISIPSSVRRGDHPPLGASPIGRQPLTQQGVGENGEILLDGLAGYAAVKGNGRVVDQFGVGKGRQVQKAGKTRQITDQPFGGDFFLEVVAQA